jgi:hypothetical protein
MDIIWKKDTDTVWVCLACGKFSEDRYGDPGSGWDVSCYINSVQAKKDHLVWGKKGQLIRIKDGGIVEEKK